MSVIAAIHASHEGVVGHKQVVRNYFSAVIDARRLELIEGMFTPDCRIHRGELPVPIEGTHVFSEFLKLSHFILRWTKTEVLHLVEEGAFVSAHLRHEVQFADKVYTPFGWRDAKDRIAGWNAMAIFRFEGDRIAEEWVKRDELGILIQLGIVQPVEH